MPSSLRVMVGEAHVLHLHPVQPCTSTGVVLMIHTLMSLRQQRFLLLKVIHCVAGACHRQKGLWTPPSFSSLQSPVVNTFLRTHLLSLTPSLPWPLPLSLSLAPPYPSTPSAMGLSWFLPLVFFSTCSLHLLGESVCLWPPAPPGSEPWDHLLIATGASVPGIAMCLKITISPNSLFCSPNLCFHSLFHHLFHLLS